MTCYTCLHVEDIIYSMKHWGGHEAVGVGMKLWSGHEALAWA